MAPTPAAQPGAIAGCGSVRRAGMLPADPGAAALAACVPRSEAARKMLFNSYFAQALDGEEKVPCSGRRLCGVVLSNNWRSDP